MTPAAGPAAARADVLVVGGGPTGLTVANLLGTFGVQTTLIERNDGTSNEAKAISLDDESLRTIQSARLDGVIYPIILPGTGTMYFSASGRPLLHARGPGGWRHGHPFKSTFAQPDLARRCCRDATAGGPFPGSPSWPPPLQPVAAAGCTAFVRAGRCGPTCWRQTMAAPVRVHGILCCSVRRDSR